MLLCLEHKTLAKQQARACGIITLRMVFDPDRMTDAQIDTGHCSAPSPRSTCHPWLLVLVSLIGKILQSPLTTEANSESHTIR